MRTFTMYHWTVSAHSPQFGCMYQNCWGQMWGEGIKDNGSSGRVSLVWAQNQILSVHKVPRKRHFSNEIWKSRENRLLRNACIQTVTGFFFFILLLIFFNIFPYTKFFPFSGFAVSGISNADKPIGNRRECMWTDTFDETPTRVEAI